MAEELPGLANGGQTWRVATRFGRALKKKILLLPKLVAAGQVRPSLADITPPNADAPTHYPRPRFAAPKCADIPSLIPLQPNCPKSVNHPMSILHTAAHPRRHALPSFAWPTATRLISQLICHPLRGPLWCHAHVALNAVAVQPNPATKHCCLSYGLP